jgi:hypothetical protein
MAFVKATIEIKSAQVGTGVKVALRRGKKSSAALSMTINETVGKKLGWQDGAKLEVLIGEGEHHGLIRLRKNASVGEAAVQKRATAKGAWFNIRLGHQPAFVDRSEASRWCQWEEVEEGWVEIVLPRWADETAPNRKTAGEVRTAQGVQQSAPHIPLKKQNVTASLMGDPPPGRREMLAEVGKLSAK